MQLHGTNKKMRTILIKEALVETVCQLRKQFNVDVFLIIYLALNYTSLATCNHFTFWNASKDRFVVPLKSVLV